MRIHHVAFRTGDLVRLEAFYAGLLGLAVTRRDGARSIWLDAGGSILMLEQRTEDEPAIDATTRELTCFAVTPSERDAFASKLTAAAIAIEERTDYTLYLRDPDGRRIALSSYPEK